MRHLGFGPITLRLLGPLSAIAWPRGARDVEIPERTPAIDVTTEVVERLPPIEATSIDTGIWQSEPVSGGTRFAVLGHQSGLVVADLTRRDSLHLRVIKDFAESERVPWFDVLIQLLVADLAPDRGGLALHAACVQVHGRALLLCGTSGVGKTTLANRLIQVGATLMSHDRTLVFGNEPWRAVSTPWGHDGMLPEAARECAPAALLFLEQASEISFEKLTGARAAARIAAVILGARTHHARMAQAMSVAAQLVREVPCYVVRLTNDVGAARRVVEQFG